jgi:uncharacterized membrane protein
MTEGPSPRDPRERPPPPSQPPPGWGPSGPGSGQGWGPPPPQGWGQQQGWGQPPQGSPQGQGGPGAFSGNVAAGLTYLLALVMILISTQVTFQTRMVLAIVPFGVGLALVLTDRRPEVRFNALQGILVWAVLVALEIGRHALFWPIAVACFFAQLFLIVMLVALVAAAFQGRHLKLPALGDFAEQQAGGPGSDPGPGPDSRGGPQGWGSPR